MNKRKADETERLGRGGQLDTNAAQCNLHLFLWKAAGIKQDISLKKNVYPGRNQESKHLLAVVNS